MTIDFGFDVGNDPPTRHVNPTVSDDGYMAIGGQLVYVGVSEQKTPVQASPKAPVARNPDPDAGWFCTDTQCIWVGDQ
jgi:hypothetical protein